LPWLNKKKRKRRTKEWVYLGLSSKKWYIEMGCEGDSFIAKLCVYFESY
jgi:hypothetical protein